MGSDIFVIPSIVIVIRIIKNYLFPKRNDIITTIAKPGKLHLKKYTKI